MANRRGGMMRSLMTLGAAGAAAYGVQRGVRNGTFQRAQQNLSNAMNNQQGQQQQATNNKPQGTTKMQVANNSQDMQEQMGYNRTSQ